jgi:hypothetical protein
MKVLGDAVLNHRCAQHQGPGGVWNQFGGKMTWDERAIVGETLGWLPRGNWGVQARVGAGGAGGGVLGDAGHQSLLQ